MLTENKLKVWEKDEIYSGDDVFFPDENITARCETRLALHYRKAVKFYFKSGQKLFEKTVPASQ